jgi:hypothetical protein
MSRILVVATAALALALPDASLGAEPPSPPPDTPSISQYIEQVPTSHGGSTPGMGKAQVRALPTNVAASFGAHPDPVSKQLKKIATSSTYGAPQRVLPKTAAGSAEPTSSNALSAAVSAVNDSGDGHLLWLLLILAFVTIAMVWAAAARPRPR